VGYELLLPMSSFYALPDCDQPIKVFTHQVNREDQHQLYGFATKTERTLFRLLLKVNGIGPKLALAILSAMSVELFVSCVHENDVDTIVKIPGVGKKTAARLLIEIGDKLKDWDALAPTVEQFTPLTASQAKNKPFKSQAENEAISALISLGYKAPQAKKAIDAFAHETLTCEELIRNALKAML
jgi:holliday junction DNA helicase RuvA